MQSHIKDVQEFLRIARDRYTFGLSVDAEDRKEAEYCNEFAANIKREGAGTSQWNEVAAKARIAASRPVETWNRLPIYVAQVVNEGRQNKPAIKVAPMDGGTKETADFFQARIRHIEYESDADTARDTAREQQVTTGRGFIRVSTEYKPGATDQSLAVDPIPNQFSVVYDPAAIKYTRADGEWCFVVSRISKEKHKRDYGAESIVNSLDFTTDGNPAPEWIGVGEGGELIQVAEYWVKDFKERVLCKLAMPDGSFSKGYQDELPADHPPIVAKRKEQCASVWQYIINGAEILEETEWIDYDIPIVPYWGREATVEGKRRTFSLICNAISPQRAVNLYVSNILEQIAQMPKTPYKVAVGSIPANLEIDYENLNNSPKAYILYNAYDEDGTRPLPPPMREVTEPPIQALTIGLNQAIDAIKAAMGIFDAALGAKSNETSGIAIERRKQQTGIVNFHFPDNEQRSNKYLGSILCRCIKKLDRAGMNVPVRDEMGKTRLVPIGVAHPDPKTGLPITVDPSVGDYGVSVSSGKSYNSQREEAFERDTALVTADPELMWVIGDQMFALDDTAGSEDRAERMKRAIEMKTPGLIQEPGQQQQIPPQVQQQMLAMQQKLQQTEAFAQSLHEQIETKKPELQNKTQLAQLDADIKLKLAQMDIDFKREQLAVEAMLKEAALGSTEAIAELTARLDVLDAERQRLHELTTLQATQDHQASLQDSAQQHQADQATQSQDAAAQSQAIGQDHEASMAEQAAENQPEAA